MMPTRMIAVRMIATRMMPPRRPVRALAAATALSLLLLAAVLAPGGGPGALLATTAAPALAGWLAASARHARAERVAPMPGEIREALNGFVDDGALDRVRYRIGGGGAHSVQAYAFLHPQTRAVALDGVIVFRDAENAAKPRYWVHEIAHLEQIRRWGLEGFAERYLRNAGAVEAEAWALTEGYVGWALRRDLEAAAKSPAGRRGGG